jgi:hypothetical protein
MISKIMRKYEVDCGSGMLPFTHGELLGNMCDSGGKKASSKELP